MSACVFSAALARDSSELPPPKLGPAPSPPARSDGDTAAPAVPLKPLPPVTISAKVESPTVALHDQVDYVVTISWEQSATVEEFPLDFEFPDPPSGAGLVLYANSFRAVTELTGARLKVVRTYTYEFHAETRGSTEVEPVTVRYYRMGDEARKQDLKTQAIPIEVTRARIKPGQVLFHPATVVLLIAAIVVITGIYARRAVKSRRAQKAAIEPEQSGEEIARQGLAEADRHRMAGDYVEFLRTLSELMRSYSRERLGIRSRAGLGQALAEKLGEEWKGRIDEFEKLGDKVRFAGYEPKPAEMDEALDTAKKLIGEGEEIYRDGQDEQDNTR